MNPSLLNPTPILASKYVDSVRVSAGREPGERSLIYLPLWRIITGSDKPRQIRLTSYASNVI